MLQLYEEYKTTGLVIIKTLTVPYSGVYQAYSLNYNTMDIYQIVV